jgi:putative sigma-54 modulation protein
MELIVKGRNIQVSNTLRKYAEDKVGRITRYFNKINKIEVELTSEKNPSVSNSQTVEVTVFSKGILVRATKSSTDMYASIDLVVDKLERQIKKYKSKLYKSLKQKEGLGRLAKVDREVEEEPEPKIVRTKQIEVKPMTPEEAALQMELLGHDFFVFANSETEEVNIVYRRRDDNYGLIRPIFGKG